MTGKPAIAKLRVIRQYQPKSLGEQRGGIVAKKVEWGSAALLLVGMQNDFCHPQGAWAKRNRLNHQEIHTVVETLLPVLAAARRAGLPVIHVALVTNSWTCWPPQAQPSATTLCWEGTWGAQFFGVEPQPGDRVITRYRPSGFLETDLDLALQAKERSSVLLAGFNGDGGVLLTGADAAARNYRVVFLRDGIAGWADPQEQETLLRFMEHQIGPVISSEEALSLWKKGKPRRKVGDR